MSKTTMKDIAEKLNISINAVSLALNDKEGVSQELRMQILELAVTMGYSQKKLNAKTILKNKTICVMIENKKKNDKYYYLDILQNLKKEAHIFGYRILEEYYSLDHFIIPQCISEQHIAGIIILGKISQEMIYQLKLYTQHILCVNHSIPYMNIDYIITNDFLGGYLSCAHLIKQGCRNIGFIGDIEKSSNFKQRFYGYRQCMINHFHPKKYELIYLTKGIEQAVLNNDYQYIQKMLLTYRKMPEAFVCVNDRNAAIVIKALQYNGYKVPQNIKIIGFDNMEFSSHMTPSLSTLEVNRQIIAKKSIKRIHEMIHENTIPETIMLSPYIIERQSTQ
ncbi:MAG: LacI family DNA-binding transcriptional regulator [Massilimicrobiota timonensis]